MDLENIVEDTNRAPLGPQANRRVDGRADNVKPRITPFDFVEAGV